MHEAFQIPEGIVIPFHHQFLNNPNGKPNPIQGQNVYSEITYSVVKSLIHVIPEPLIEYRTGTFQGQIALHW